MSDIAQQESYPELIEQLLARYQRFDTGALPHILALYDDQAVFVDPIKRLEGKQALATYFEAMTDGLSACRFTFHHVLVTTGDTVSEASLYWDMTFSHPKLHQGKTLTLPGTSHIRFNHLIHYHRDYYDLGQMLYEHLPLVGTLIRTIKKRI